MNTEIYYFISPKHQLIIETYCGPITFDAYTQMKNTQFKHKDYNSSYDVIADFRTATIIEDGSLSDLLSFFKQNNDKIQKRRSALIVDKPFETSKAYIFSHSIEKVVPINSNVFSTLEGAYTFLGKPVKELLEIYK